MLPGIRDVHVGEGSLDEVANRMSLAGCQYKIVGLIGPYNHVHPNDVIPGVSPVALGIEVSQIEAMFEAGFNSKATFYNWVKKNLNVCPSEYIKGLRSDQFESGKLGPR